MIANWPGYIFPSAMKRFERQTGTTAEYLEVIENYDSFFGSIREPLANGDATGYDVIMLADWLVAKMASLDYLEELHPELLPNFEANAVSTAKNPTYDPGARHSVTWLSGITGIGYNRSVTGRDITSIQDLFNPEFEGGVMMSLEMRETMGLTLLGLGIDPQEATVEDATTAQEELIKQRDSGVLRSYADFGDRLQALSNGDAALSMIVAGDLLLAKQDNPDLEFVVPDEGAITWSDNLATPIGAENPADAHTFMNFMYEPDTAAGMVQYINYFTPVPPSRDVLLEKAADASGEERETLENLAADPFVYPDDEMLSQLYPYNMLTNEEEEQEWNDLFQEVVQG
ncbi:MAG: spermidine/putrescine ABC transporter substrate-binding protein [Actinomycetota bacterium]